MSDAFTGATIHCSGWGLIHVSHAQWQWTYESARWASAASDHAVTSRFFSKAVKAALMHPHLLLMRRSTPTAEINLDTHTHKHIYIMQSHLSWASRPDQKNILMKAGAVLSNLGLNLYVMGSVCVGFDQVWFHFVSLHNIVLITQKSTHRFKKNFALWSHIWQYHTYIIVRIILSQLFIVTTWCLMYAE